MGARTIRVRPRRGRLLAVAALSVALSGAALRPAAAEELRAPANGAPAAADARCRLTMSPMMGPGTLPRTAAALAGGAPLTVVALGSSSTQGYGASSPDKAFPPQLAALLKARFPDVPISVANKGVGGEDTEAMLARLDRDVFALKPQLVIWQTGTNDVIHHLPLDRFRAALSKGLALMKEKGVDIILMSPQFAPQFVSTPHYDSYLDALRDAAESQKVTLFRRFAVTQRYASDTRFRGVALIGPDGLHPTDATYRCTAVLLAEAIAGQVRQATR